MIKLTDLIKINPKDYKLHLAVTSEEGVNPLDVFIRDKDEWKLWQAYRGSKNEWTRPYIFSLIKFHNFWLFGGIYTVIKRHNTRYEVELASQFESLIGRLLISGIPTNRGRGRSYNLETYFDQFEINQIFQNMYDGQDFPGYENINVSFKNLEHIVRINKADWKTALQNLKGVYLITDTKTNKRYVGSAYGTEGIWTRWCSYINNGHGGNKLLRKLIKAEGLTYAKENYQFTLLEFRPMKTDDKDLILRESYWKRVLISKSEFGYNNN
ncbi:GIY-YIG nuclease family protein [Croceibacter atlanticus]|uniref:GIY-YIG nuclease family protein n=1 Tax=Croceibacter atlanticus TaxID=313588 RepID=UPI001C5D272F|nr:GIY-YIG nuclease family protein [Croceibacter atlanticus]MBW4968843.1 GIY-YIG nuclease family protein [Croceibacter atlanticus]